MTDRTVGPTRDPEQARHDLDTAGYCIVPDLIPDSLRQRLVERVRKQAAAEREQSVANLQDGNTQWVGNVLNKGAAFMKLLTCADASHALVRHVLGHDYILSCSNAPIAGPGTSRMAMHADQHWTPTLPKHGVPNPRLGDLRYDVLDRATSAGERPGVLFPACMVTLMWTLTDFTRDNGATVFVPGSHLSGCQPEPHAPLADAVPAEAPAGSVILWDGRIWHATGANVTKDAYRIGVTNNYVAPMIRPLVNYPYSLRPEVAANLTGREQQLLGFSTWTSYGNEGVPSNRFRHFRPAAEQPGEMRPIVDV